MSRISILVVFGLLTSAAFAQREQPERTGEIYALASASGGSDIPGATSAGGFCIGGAWKPSARLGLVADFSRHFASDAHASFDTFTAGPRIISREHNRLSGFVQVLTGGERSTLAGQPADWNYVVAPGVGADIRLTDNLVWRAVQVDLTLTQGPGLLRVSTGLVFRFGSR